MFLGCNLTFENDALCKTGGEIILLYAVKINNLYFFSYSTSIFFFSVGRLVVIYPSLVNFFSRRDMLCSYNSYITDLINFSRSVYKIRMLLLRRLEHALHCLEEVIEMVACNFSHYLSIRVEEFFIGKVLFVEARLIKVFFLSLSRVLNLSFEFSWSSSAIFHKNLFFTSSLRVPNVFKVDFTSLFYSAKRLINVFSLSREATSFKAQQGIAAAEIMHVLSTDSVVSVRLFIEKLSVDFVGYCLFVRRFFGHIWFLFVFYRKISIFGGVFLLNANIEDFFSGNVSRSIADDSSKLVPLNLYISRFFFSDFMCKNKVIDTFFSDYSKIMGKKYLDFVVFFLLSCLSVSANEYSVVGYIFFCLSSFFKRFFYRYCSFFKLRVFLVKLNFFFFKLLGLFFFRKSVFGNFLLGLRSSLVRVTNFTFAIKIFSNLLGFVEKLLTLVLKKLNSFDLFKSIFGSMKSLFFLNIERFFFCVFYNRLAGIWSKNSMHSLVSPRSSSANIMFDKTAFSDAVDTYKSDKLWLFLFNSGFFSGNNFLLTSLFSRSGIAYKKLLLARLFGGGVDLQTNLASVRSSNFRGGISAVKFQSYELVEFFFDSLSLFEDTVGFAFSKYNYYDHLFLTFNEILFSDFKKRQLNDVVLAEYIHSNLKINLTEEFFWQVYNKLLLKKSDYYIDDPMFLSGINFYERKHNLYNSSFAEKVLNYPTSTLFDFFNLKLKELSVNLHGDKNLSGLRIKQNLPFFSKLASLYTRPLSEFGMYPHLNTKNFSLYKNSPYYKNVDTFLFRKEFFADWFFHGVSVQKPFNFSVFDVFSSFTSRYLDMLSFLRFESLKFRGRLRPRRLLRDQKKNLAFYLLVFYFLKSFLVDKRHYFGSVKTDRSLWNGFFMLISHVECTNLIRPNYSDLFFTPVKYPDRVYPWLYRELRSKDFISNQFKKFFKLLPKDVKHIFADYLKIRDKVSLPFDSVSDYSYDIFGRYENRSSLLTNFLHRKFDYLYGKSHVENERSIFEKSVYSGESSLFFDSDVFPLQKHLSNLYFEGIGNTHGADISAMGALENFRFFVDSCLMNSFFLQNFFKQAKSERVFSIKKGKKLGLLYSKSFTKPGGLFVDKFLFDFMVFYLHYIYRLFIFEKYIWKEFGFVCSGFYKIGFFEIKSRKLGFDIYKRFNYFTYGLGANSFGPDKVPSKFETMVYAFRELTSNDPKLELNILTNNERRMINKVSHMKNIYKAYDLPSYEGNLVLPFDLYFMSRSNSSFLRQKAQQLFLFFSDISFSFCRSFKIGNDFLGYVYFDLSVWRENWFFFYAITQDFSRFISFNTGFFFFYLSIPMFEVYQQSVEYYYRFSEIFMRDRDAEQGLSDFTVKLSDSWFDFVDRYFGLHFFEFFSTEPLDFYDDVGHFNPLLDDYLVMKRQNDEPVKDILYGNNLILDDEKYESIGFNGLLLDDDFKYLSDIHLLFEYINVTSLSFQSIFVNLKRFAEFFLFFFFVLYNFLVNSYFFFVLYRIFRFFGSCFYLFVFIYAYIIYILCVLFNLLFYCLRRVYEAFNFAVVFDFSLVFLFFFNLIIVYIVVIINFLFVKCVYSLFFYFSKILLWAGKGLSFSGSLRDVFFAGLTKIFFLFFFVLYRIAILYFVFIFFFMNYDNIMHLFPILFNVEISVRTFSMFYLFILFCSLVIFLNPVGYFGQAVWNLRYEYICVVFILWFFAGYINAIDVLLMDLWDNFLHTSNVYGYQIYRTFEESFLYEDFQDREFYANSFRGLWDNTFMEFIFDWVNIFDEVSGFEYVEEAKTIFFFVYNEINSIDFVREVTSEVGMAFDFVKRDMAFLYEYFIYYFYYYYYQSADLFNNVFLKKLFIFVETHAHLYIVDPYMFYNNLIAYMFWTIDSVGVDIKFIVKDLLVPWGIFPQIYANRGFYLDTKHGLMKVDVNSPIFLSTYYKYGLRKTYTNLWGQYRMHPSHFFSFYSRDWSYWNEASVMEIEDPEETDISPWRFVHKHDVKDLVEVSPYFEWGVGEEYFSRTDGRIFKPTNERGGYPIYYDRRTQLLHPYGPSFVNGDFEPFFATVLVPDLAFIGSTTWFFESDLLGLDTSIKSDGLYGLRFLEDQNT